MAESGGPMVGVRVLDISNIVAGPLACGLLADFGADVIKVEMPGQGDALRNAPPWKNGVPLWWKVTNRNKRCMTLALNTAEGQELLKRLTPYLDVLVESFRPGVLERWGLGWKTLRELNSRLILLRVTAYGQTGPYANKGGFGRMAEAFGGLTYITGSPDSAPLHVGYPIADALTGVFGAMAIAFALRERDQGSGEGQYIDLSLYESVLRVLEFLVIQYDQLGTVHERGGNLSQYAVPSNVYTTRDGRWVSITASTRVIYDRFMRAIGRPELADDSDMKTPQTRLQWREMLDRVVAEWVSSRVFEDVDAVLGQADAGYAPVNSVRELFGDPHIAARENIVSVPDSELGTVRMQGLTPKFSRTPGAVRSAGAKSGEHTEHILQELLRLQEFEVSELRAKGVI